jgi:hypothetical protein
MDEETGSHRRWVYPLVLIVIVLIVRFFFG